MTERIKSLLDRTFEKEQRKFRRDVDWTSLLERFVSEGTCGACWSMLDIPRCGGRLSR